VNQLLPKEYRGLLKGFLRANKAKSVFGKKRIRMAASYGHRFQLGF